MHAFCYASGQIGFGARIPAGALPIAKGPRTKLVEWLEAVARHAYDGEALLVPGVPEADNQDDALDALLAFTAWAAKGAPAGVETIHSRHRSTVGLTDVVLARQDAQLARLTSQPKPA